MSCAMELLDSDHEVMVIEKNSELFLGTSGSTHNRAHMGYHYPRAGETVQECLDGLELFKRQFPDVLINPGGNYYAFSKLNSMTSNIQFEEFCHKFNLPFQKKWPNKNLFIRDSISNSFLVPEMIFDTEKMIEHFAQWAKENEVIIKTNTELLEGRKISRDQFKIRVNEKGKFRDYRGDIVVNATYAYSNNIMKAFGLEHHMKKYKLQIVEIAVVKSQQKIPGITIMDGPFISIMPYGKSPDKYLVYDAEHSIVDQKEGYLIDDSIDTHSNWEKMKTKGRDYFPFMNDLEYVDSLRAYRPVPIQDEHRDRSTKIKSYDDFSNFYSILEGKFISAPLMAKELKNIIFTS